MTEPQDVLAEALRTALSVALHEQADPDCIGEPSYDVTRARAEAITEAVMRMPLIAAALVRTPETLDVELAEARATIEAMSGDAADLHDLMDEAAALRTALAHVLIRTHDSGCGVCDAARALLTAEHEPPSRALPAEPQPPIDAVPQERGFTSDYTQSEYEQAWADGVEDGVRSLKAPPEPPIDAERLAVAICASRPPEPAKDSDLFVDDECHGLAIRVVAEYERLSVAVTPKHSAAWLAATKPDSRRRRPSHPQARGRAGMNRVHGGRDKRDREEVPMPEPQNVLAEAGKGRYRGPHKPVGEGLCEHRWRNRTTVQVHCGWADGYRAAPSPHPGDAGLRAAASRYRAAEWDIRCHEDSIRDEAHNARVEEWRAADAALAALLGESSPVAPSAEPPETDT